MDTIRLSPEVEQIAQQDSTPNLVLEPKIALGMIVKNEEKVILKTLQSAIDAVDCIFIYDTGSTDNTVSIIKEFEKQISPKKIYMLHGEFINFEVTRNELLKFIDNHHASQNVDFCLLLDANDEFHGTAELREFVRDRVARPDDDEGGFYIEQRWLYGEVIDKYYNIFLIRPRMGWKYYGVVHEYIGPKDIHLAKSPQKCPSNIYIYQDRNENCEQSFVRYTRDYKMLVEELAKNPTDPRTLFYLGQTCDCLELYNEAFAYYKRRVALGRETEKGFVGFPEEIYHAHYRLGNLCIRLNKSHGEILENYGNAMEFWNRVEPMMRLCEYYLFMRNQPLVAYGYASMALFARYPDEALLFTSDTDYTYRRYNRFMVSANLVGDFIRAYEIGQQMVELGIAQESDVTNLKIIKENLELAREGKPITFRAPTKINDNNLLI
jgi:glycosyltransferase involved in cell wall biosynthesis